MLFQQKAPSTLTPNGLRDHIFGQATPVDVLFRAFTPEFLAHTDEAGNNFLHWVINKIHHINIATPELLTETQAPSDRVNRLDAKEWVRLTSYVQYFHRRNVSLFQINHALQSAYDLMVENLTEPQINGLLACIQLTRAQANFYNNSCKDWSALFNTPDNSLLCRNFKIYLKRLINEGDVIKVATHLAQLFPDLVHTVDNRSLVTRLWSRGDVHVLEPYVYGILSAFAKNDSVQVAAAVGVLQTFLAPVVGDQAAVGPRAH